MKRVPLEKKKIDLSDMGGPESDELDYAQHIINVLRRPKDPNAGSDAEEMATVLPIMTKVKAAAAKDRRYVDLEDAEHKEVAERITEFRFAFNHESLLEMQNAIKDAPTPKQRKG